MNTFTSKRRHRPHIQLQRAQAETETYSSPTQPVPTTPCVRRSAIEMQRLPPATPQDAAEYWGVIRVVILDVNRTSSQDDLPSTPLHPTTPQRTLPCPACPAGQTGHDNHSVRASHPTGYSTS